MAELALAIVPIAFATIKGFSILSEKTHLLRHYRKEVKWLRTKLNVQTLCFRGEVHHLVIDAVDTMRAQVLIRDDNNAYWHDKDLDSALRKHLGELYPQFTDAIREVKTALEEIEAKLAVFAQPDVTSPLFKATKDRFRLVFKKEEYKENLQALKEWIGELKRIRKLAKAVGRESAARARETRREKSPEPSRRSEDALIAVVKQYRASRYLSSQFQSLLQQGWSCCDPCHSYHSGRLFITGILRGKSLLWMYESTGRTGYTALRNRLLFNVSSQQLGPPTPESLTSDTNQSEYLDIPMRKRRKLSPQSQGEWSDQPAPQAVSSAALENLCYGLQACSITPCPKPLSYSDVQRRTTFQFEPQPVEGPGLDTHRITSLAELLSRQVQDVLLNRERIQLAAALVRGTLANHSSLGWPQGCLIESISFLSEPSGDVDVALLLETLNMPTQMGQAASPDTDMDCDAAVLSKDEFEYKYGIQNLVLYRLGVALLSIGLWSRVDWEDVEAVRRKVPTLDSLGMKFQNVVRRLIYGNFGVDTTDLNDERLQIEILRAVICPLEKRAGSHRHAGMDSAAGPRQEALN